MINIEKLVAEQRKYFNSRQTFDVDFRIAQLQKLKHSIEENLPQLLEAFQDDLNKSEYDVYLTELYMVNSEIDYLIKNLKKLTRPRKTKNDLITMFSSKGKIVPEPYGVTLIISPWNYPVQLSLLPLAGAIAGGNTVVLKPSSSSLAVSKVIKRILSVFEDKYVSCVMGTREELATLFDQQYDFAFFTGSENSGKELLEKLSKNLTPVVLELGGKSPFIVDYDADINVAAKKCVWGKFLNAGQTCIAPDYALVHETIKEKFIERVKEEIRKQFYVGDLLNPDFVKIISERQKKRIEGFIDASKVIVGGNFDGLTLEPTVMDNVSFDDAIMQEEIFAPILPIISFTTLSEEIDRLKTKKKPLALYYFSKDRLKQDYVMTNALYGGGCINDCILHVCDSHLPFGGVGSSGMGQYHGTKTFETFSHFKSVLCTNSNFDLKLKYMPYTRRKLKSVKRLCK